MSVLDGDHYAPSDWVEKRFGHHAGRLVKAIPVQMARAHARAHAVHRTAGLKKRSPYGVTLAEAVREHLADMARELDEAVRDVRGYEYAVINDHALFPFRYADRPRPLDRARLPANASPTRHRLFRAHGPQPRTACLTLMRTWRPRSTWGCTKCSRSWELPPGWSVCSSRLTPRTASMPSTGGTHTSNPTALSHGLIGNSCRSLQCGWSDGRWGRGLDVAGRG